MLHNLLAPGLRVRRWETFISTLGDVEMTFALKWRSANKTPLLWRWKWFWWFWGVYSRGSGGRRPLAWGFIYLGVWGSNPPHMFSLTSLWQRRLNCLPSFNRERHFKPTCQRSRSRMAWRSGITYFVTWC